jgi:hypothetical protein
MATNKEHRFWELTRSEWIMAILTILGILVAALTGWIFYLQLDEMRTDERAWLSMTASQVHFPDLGSTVPLHVTLTLTNTGKTVVRKLFGEFTVEYVVNGDSPDFDYSHKLRRFQSGGAMIPNAPERFDVIFETQLPGKPVEPRFLTPSEYNDLKHGNAYMVVIGRNTYEDIFGRRHWLHTCSFFIAPEPIEPIHVSAQRCTDYNDTGDGDDHALTDSDK